VSEIEGAGGAPVGADVDCGALPSEQLASANAAVAAVAARRNPPLFAIIDATKPYVICLRPSAAEKRPDEPERRGVNEALKELLASLNSSSFEMTNNQGWRAIAGEIYSRLKGIFKTGRREHDFGDPTRAAVANDVHCNVDD
jgi:hypothetical protein